MHRANCWWEKVNSFFIRHAGANRTWSCILLTFDILHPPPHRFNLQKVISPRDLEPSWKWDRLTFPSRSRPAAGTSRRPTSSRETSSSCTLVCRRLRRRIPENPTIVHFCSQSTLSYVLLTVPKAPSESFDSIRSLCRGNSGTAVCSSRLFNADSTSCWLGDCKAQEIR